jgi:probable rRNA maturation factor
MTIDLVVQNACGHEVVPEAAEFNEWLAPVLADKGAVAVTIRIVDEQEMQALNSKFRGQDKATNVLAFPAELPEPVRKELEAPPLGDIVICASVVEAEAKSQGKAPLNHWAHLTVHGVLHLFGHDHQDNEQAAVMEALECEYLSRLGISNPYQS